MSSPESMSELQEDTLQSMTREIVCRVIYNLPALAEAVDIPEGIRTLLFFLAGGDPGDLDQEEIRSFLVALSPICLFKNKSTLAFSTELKSGTPGYLFHLNYRDLTIQVEKTEDIGEARSFPPQAASAALSPFVDTKSQYALIYPIEDRIYMRFEPPSSSIVGRKCFYRFEYSDDEAIHFTEMDPFTNEPTEKTLTMDLHDREFLPNILRDHGYKVYISDSLKNQIGQWGVRGLPHISLENAQEPGDTR